MDAGTVLLSPKALRLLGIGSDDVAQPPTWKRLWENLHPHDQDRVRQITTEAFLHDRPFDLTLRFRSPGGAWRIYLVHGLLSPGTRRTSRRITGFVQDITGRTRSEQAHRHLARTLMRARDEERRRLARDLHESAGQSLAALKMTLRLLRRTLPKEDSKLRSLLGSSLELLEGAMQEVRTVSYVMHPPMLDEAGLGSALRWFARGFSRRSGIQVRVEIAGDFGRLAQEIETTIFRIVQEALTNTHRYSGSRMARISVVRQGEHVRAEISDDGCGLPSSTRGLGHPSLPGVGIASMRERVEHLNGTFRVESIPGQGTTVRAILPLLSLEAFSLDGGASRKSRTSSLGIQVQPKGEDSNGIKALSRSDC